MTSFINVVKDPSEARPTDKPVCLFAIYSSGPLTLKLISKMTIARLSATELPPKGTVWRILKVEDTFAA
jgi:hypothetical protein